MQVFISIESEGCKVKDQNDKSKIPKEDKQQ